MKKVIKIMALLALVGASTLYGAGASRRIRPLTAVQISDYVEDINEGTYFIQTVLDELLNQPHQIQFLQEAIAQGLAGAQGHLDRVLGRAPMAIEVPPAIVAEAPIIVADAHGTDVNPIVVDAAGYAGAGNQANIHRITSGQATLAEILDEIDRQTAENFREDTALAEYVEEKFADPTARDEARQKIIFERKIELEAHRTETIIQEWEKEMIAERIPDTDVEAPTEEEIRQFITDETDMDWLRLQHRNRGKKEFLDALLQVHPQSADAAHGIPLTNRQHFAVYFRAQQEHKARVARSAAEVERLAREAAGADDAVVADAHGVFPGTCSVCFGEEQVWKACSRQHMRGDGTIAECQAAFCRDCFLTTNKHEGRPHCPTCSHATSLGTFWHKDTIPPTFRETDQDRRLQDITNLVGRISSEHSDEDITGIYNAREDPRSAGVRAQAPFWRIIERVLNLYIHTQREETAEAAHYQRLLGDQAALALEIINDHGRFNTLLNRVRERIDYRGFGRGLNAGIAPQLEDF